MKILDQGWLHARPELSNIVAGVEIPPETRTRKEEYTFVVESLHDVPGRLLLDSATGYVPEWHKLAYILGESGWTVIATDMEPAVLGLPPHDAVTYGIADSRWIPFPNELFDVSLCISTLEHTIVTDAFAIVRELLRVTKPGGRVILTADYGAWLPCLICEVLDPTPPPEDTLDPPVYYVIVEA
jgi:ubiquinone/menaquinone biosynthesis C-methylase UbiE